MPAFLPFQATTFKLVRHAVHDHGADILCGRLPGVALSAAGQAQLPWLRLGAGPGIAAVYSSPQRRCLQTAAAFGRAVTMEPALDEIDFGAWTGRSFSALGDDPDWRRWNADRDHGQAPGGESAAAAQARAVDAIATLQRRHAGGVVVLVSHADIIKSMLLHHLGLPLQGWARIEIHPASISTLILSDGSPLVASMNETG